MTCLHSPADLIDATDRDSLHTLALAIVPFEHPMLRRARLVKNNRLISVPEVFRDPDVANARRKLAIMAATLGIGLPDIPRFLEDYADIFLSLSYYRQCLDHITPIVEDFLDCMRDLKKSFQMRSNVQLMTTCD